MELKGLKCTKVVTYKETSECSQMVEKKEGWEMEAKNKRRSRDNVGETGDPGWGGWGGGEAKEVSEVADDLGVTPTPTTLLTARRRGEEPAIPPPLHQVYVLYVLTSYLYNVC
jgi:hypothetical protein